MYRDIVFLQDEDAIEALELLEQDTNKALEYLKQWEYGDSEVLDESSTCNADNKEYIDNYVIGYNDLVGYIYLLRIEQ